MSEREDNSGCIPKGGCAGCGCVLTVGLAFAVFGAAIGFGVSGRIPFTDSNVTIAGSTGSKDLSREVLPSYVSNRVGSSEDFINGTQTLTVGPIEGTSIAVVGEQEGSPALDLNLSIKRGRERIR